MEIHILFIILISAGLAFGIYGVVVQQGANLVRMDMRTAAMGLVWGTIQLCASLAGYGTGRWILNFEMERERSIFWVNLLAGMILVCIGIRMLLKALQKKSFLEHRMACGLLLYSLPVLLISAFAITVISAVGGYISGQIWGAEPCSRAFGIGGTLLFLTGIALQLVQFG